MEQFQNQTIKIVTYRREQVNQQRKRQIKAHIISLMDGCNVNLAHIGIKKMFPNIFSFEIYDIQETYNIIQKIFQSHQQILNQRDYITKQFRNLQQRNAHILTQRNNMQRQYNRLQTQIRKLQEAKKTNQKAIQYLTKQRNKQVRQTKQGKQLNRRLKLELKNQKQKFQKQRQKYIKKQPQRKARQYQKGDVEIIQYSNYIQRHNFSQRVINENINKKMVFDKGLQQKFKQQILKSTQDELKKTQQQNYLLRQWLHYFFGFVKQVNKQCMQTVAKIQQIQYSITQDIQDIPSNICIPMLRDRRHVDQFISQTTQFIRSAYEINLKHNKQIKEMSDEQQKNIQAAQLVRTYRKIVKAILKQYQKIGFEKQQLKNHYLKYFPQTDHVKELISLVTIQKAVSFNNHQQFVYNRLRQHRKQLLNEFQSMKRQNSTKQQVGLLQKAELFMRQIKDYNTDQVKNQIHKQLQDKNIDQERKMLLKDKFSQDDLVYIKQIMDKHVRNNTNKVEIQNQYKLQINNQNKLETNKVEIQHQNKVEIQHQNKQNKPNHNKIQEIQLQI